VRIPRNPERERERGPILKNTKKKKEACCEKAVERKTRKGATQAWNQKKTTEDIS